MVLPAAELQYSIHSLKSRPGKVLRFAARYGLAPVSSQKRMNSPVPKELESVPPQKLVRALRFSPTPSCQS